MINKNVMGIIFCNTNDAYLNELTAISRRGQLLEILRDQEQITVKEMAQKFCVSEMTIRRDLHGMEEQGLVTIHYGGASLRNTHPGFPSFTARQEKLYQNKLKIAVFARNNMNFGNSRKIFFVYRLNFCNLINKQMIF